MQCGPTNPAAAGRSTGAAELIASESTTVSVDLQPHTNCSQPGPSLDFSGRWVWIGNKAWPAYSVVFTAVKNTPNTYLVAGGVCGKNACEAVYNPATHTLAMVKGFKLTAKLSADTNTFTWTNTATWTRQTSCGGTAVLTLTGPSDRWFGVGFGAHTMSDKPWAIVADGHGAVTERKLADHAAGTLLPTSVAVVENTVANGRRTLVVSRLFAGKTADYFTFDAGATGIPVISAVGNGADLAFHKVSGGSAVMLVKVGAPACICSGGSSGSIDGVRFNNHCPPPPSSTLLEQKNDICFFETYGGGLKCCAHNSILLDKNQTVPTALDKYKMKFRLYYEDYTSQRHAFFMFITNEPGAGEYDIPKCAPGTPPEECIYTSTGIFRVRDSMRKCSNLADVWCAPGWNEKSDVLLLRAGTHCHAPACIDEVLTVNATGEVICVNRPLYGTPGSVAVHNEQGYAAGIPPCLWGTAEEGLRTPPRLSLDTVLKSVKRVNNTNYHYGVMAQWQMRGAWADPSPAL